MLLVYWLVGRSRQTMHCGLKVYDLSTLQAFAMIAPIEDFILRFIYIGSNYE